MPSAEERKTLIKLGLEVHHEAEDIARLGYWNLTGDRLHYATFHMARTLLLDKGMESHTHAGTIHLIGKNSIAEGLPDKSYGRLLSQSYELRQSGDYDDRFDATKEEAQPFFGQVRAIHRRREKLAFLPPGMSCSA